MFSVILELFNWLPMPFSLLFIVPVGIMVVLALLQLVISLLNVVKAVFF